MFLLLIGYSLLFSALDIKEHRISNRFLLSFLFLAISISWFSGASIFAASAFFYGAAALILTYFGLGAGDLKLLMVLAFFYLPPTQEITVKFLSAFSSIAIFSVIAQLIITRRLSGSIALAPALCGAVIWCAR